MSTTFTSPLPLSKPPNLDLLTYVFGTDDSKDTDDPIYINPEKPDDEFLSKKSARCLLKKLVAGFKAYGLAPGDVVCMCTTNTIYHPIVCLAVAAAGGIWTAINPALTPEEMKRHFTKSDTKFLFCSPEFLEKGRKTALSCGIPESRVFGLDGLSSSSSSPGSSSSWTQLLNHGLQGWTPFDDEQKAKNTTICLYPTSGTSGPPKLAMLSHHNLVAGDHLVNQIEPQPYQVRTLLLWPLFHAAALTYSHVTPIRGSHCYPSDQDQHQSRPTYFPPRFDPITFLDHVQKYEINNTSLAPAMMLAIIHHLPSIPKPAKQAKLASLRFGMCGSSPMGPELYKMWRELLPEKCPWNNVYGMTETNGVITKTFYPEFDNVAGSRGALIPGCEGKIVPDDDNDDNVDDGSSSSSKGRAETEAEAEAEIEGRGKAGAGAGAGRRSGGRKTGELLVKGPNVFQGYFRDPEANAKTFDEHGFMFTGDVAYVDVDGGGGGGEEEEEKGKGKGKVFIVDRKKELIKVRGFQVAPAELESVLMGHPSVAEAAVIGVSDPQTGDELPRAYVVRVADKGKGGEEGNEEEKEKEKEDIKGYLASRLISYKRLTGGVRFLDALPRNANNKVLKRELRAWAKRGEGDGDKSKL